MKRAFRSPASVATAIVTIGVAAPVSAQSLEQLANEAVLELCPELMEIETPLADDERIVARGYEVEATREHSRVGTVDVVGLRVDDGSIWIANSRDASFCQVGLEGVAARGAYEKLLQKRHLLDTMLVPDPAAKSPSPDVSVTSFRTPAIGGVYLGVQYVDLSKLRPDEPLIVQQYLLEE